MRSARSDRTQRGQAGVHASRMREESDQVQENKAEGGSTGERFAGPWVLGTASREERRGGQRSIGWDHPCWSLFSVSGYTILICAG